PTISTLTGWRALRAAPRGHLVDRIELAQEGFEPSASLVLSESGLPVAYRAVDRRDFAGTTQGGIRTHRRPGLGRAARPVGVPGLGPDPVRESSDAEAVGLEPTSGHGRHLLSRQAPDPAGWLPKALVVPV